MGRDVYQTGHGWICARLGNYGSAMGVLLILKARCIDASEELLWLGRAAFNLTVLQEFIGFLDLCVVGRIVSREAEILPAPV